ncbi:nuclear transport factor 2 family protein [Novosphingobium sp. Chol11]|jgi:ketosteroid isomerase-like protein|uniref:nuclear transport factor 2 family protein n=1 Tax=Novosphingobium sp. Chol11 TaxID=1385763 RepID=UPI0025E9D7A0|nr:nuclear transport factor 2 family protein [Novosphingobium sp. Chol11]
MQYEPHLSRAELIELATIRYFGSVDRKDMEAVLDCFHDGALLCVQTEFTRHAGKAAIRKMFEGFMGAYASIVHKDFVCTVDEKNGRITASFEAVLTGDDGSVTRLFNTNFWRIRDGKFQEVYVYFSGANVLV